MTAGRPREFNYDEALEKAIHVFWQKGYEGTSMPDLTEAMGMSKPSIYASFGNKEELFRKALDSYAQKAITLLRELLDAPTLRESIERFLMGTADSLSCKDKPRGCFVVQSALVGSDEAKTVCKEAGNRREVTVKILDERFRRAVAEGELPADTDTKHFARFYASVQQGMAVQSVNGGLSCADFKGVAKLALAALPCK